ncbi:MAG: hypothetical protein AAGC68_12190, partial [Verrucomicrobiota bacterium]
GGHGFGSSGERSGKPSLVAGMIGVLFLTLSCGPALATEGGQVDPEVFRQSVDETMEQKKYQWQLSRRDLAEGEDAVRQNWMKRRVSGIAEATREAIQAASDAVENFFERLRRESESGPSASPELNRGAFAELKPLLSVALTVIVIGLLGWVLLVVYRKFKGATGPEQDPVDSVVIDLQSEDIVASQLPEDEWMRLAREQVDRGDRRLAIRAVFLASLSNLGEKGFLKIARFKSNRDYSGELERKGRQRDELRKAFNGNVRTFERTWYGLHPVEEQHFDEFLARHELISRESEELMRRSSPQQVEAGSR